MCTQSAQGRSKQEAASIPEVSLMGKQYQLHVFVLSMDVVEGSVFKGGLSGGRYPLWLVDTVSVQQCVRARRAYRLRALSSL